MDIENNFQEYLGSSKKNLSVSYEKKNDCNELQKKYLSTSLPAFHHMAHEFRFHHYSSRKKKVKNIKIKHIL